MATRATTVTPGKRARAHFKRITEYMSKAFNFRFLVCKKKSHGQRLDLIIQREWAVSLTFEGIAEGHFPFRHNPQVFEALVHLQPLKLIGP